MKQVFSHTLVLGLMAMPIKAYKVASSDGIALKQVHRDCGGPLGLTRRCKGCGEVDLPLADFTKAVERPDETLQVLTDVELAELAPPKDKVIHLQRLLTEPLDPSRIDLSYYLAPGEGADGSYLALVEALGEQSVQVDLTLFGKQRSAVLQVYGSHLVLRLLHFEMRERPDAPEGEADRKLVHQARTLLQEMPRGLDEPRDTYSEAVRGLITVVETGPARPTSTLLKRLARAADEFS